MCICVCFVDISEFLALNKIQQTACRKAVTRHIISMEEDIFSLGYNNGGTSDTIPKLSLPIHQRGLIFNMVDYLWNSLPHNERVTRSFTAFKM